MNPIHGRTEGLKINDPKVNSSLVTGVIMAVIGAIIIMPGSKSGSFYALPSEWVFFVTIPAGIAVFLGITWVIRSDKRDDF